MPDYLERRAALKADLAAATAAALELRAACNRFLKATKALAASQAADEREIKKILSKLTAANPEPQGDHR